MNIIYSNNEYVLIIQLLKNVKNDLIRMFAGFYMVEEFQLYIVPGEATLEFCFHIINKYPHFQWQVFP